MRLARLLCVASIGAMLISSVDAADAGRKRKKRRVNNTAAAASVEPKRATVRTNQVASLRARPGESSALVTKLPKGEAVIVLERSGRWVFVRAGEHRGWLTRTLLERKKRARKGPEYRAAAWQIEERADDDAAPRDLPSDDATPEVRSRPAGPPPPLRDPRLAMSAAVGYRSLGIDFSSDGAAGIGNYVIDMAAMTAAVAARTRVLPHAAFSVELDGEYRFTYGRPGIHYQSSSGAAGDIPFVQHELDAGATLGAWVHPGGHATRIAARAGYHYGAFLVDDTDNVGMLASESLSGPIAGASARVQPRGSSYQLHAAVDALLGGVREQTEGLEDGMTSSASAIWARAGAGVPLSAGLELGLEYRYERAATTWSGQSARQVDATSARRIDISHIAIVGVGRAF
jgi:hypothetical protein